MGHSDGERYCEDCCIKAVAKVNKELPEGEEEAWVDGGWGGALCDGYDEGPNHCDECGKMLDYSLSITGIENEVNHFDDYFLKDKNIYITEEMEFELYQLFNSFTQYSRVRPEIEKRADVLAHRVLVLLGQTIDNRFELMDLEE
jgi:hypothetical protein